MASSLFCRSAGLYRDSNASAAPSGSASNNNNNSTNKQKQLRVLNYSTINLPPPSSPSPSPSPASPSTVHNDFLGYAPLAISASASDLSSLHCVFQGSDSAMSRFPEPSYDNSESSSSSCFMSSISDDNEEEDDEEVQSSSFDSSSSPSSSSSSSSSDTLSSSFPSLKQSGALDTFDSLASALPIKRGLSSYFRGKSQSFSCLGAISTVAELAKPEDPFAKKRRTSSNLMKKYRSHPSRCGSNGAISKRHSSSNGSTGLRSHARSPRSHHHRYMKPLPSSKCFSVPELQEAAAF